MANGCNKYQPLKKQNTLSHWYTLSTPWFFMPLYLMIPAFSFILYSCYIKYTSLIVIHRNTQIKNGEFVFVTSRQLIKQAAAHTFLSKQNLWKRMRFVCVTSVQCLLLCWLDCVKPLESMSCDVWLMPTYWSPSRVPKVCEMLKVVLSLPSCCDSIQPLWPVAQETRGGQYIYSEHLTNGEARSH